MGSIIMDGAVVRSHVLLGAGSLVSPGKELESGFLYLGSPVKKVRRLTEQEISWIDYSANHYVNLKNRYIG
jgi:carbonic anhydrase/acetyltransferase-like protein (isoleucine patch superfamily)